MTTTIYGAELNSVTGRILTADRMQAHNTFDAPNTVAPRSFEGASLNGNRLTINLPAKSIVVLELR